MVDEFKCIGCGLCTGACPWEMIAVDPDDQKATKCFNCAQCAQACPNGALRYVSWKDKTKDTPPRVSAMKISAGAAAANCAPCHTRS